MGRIYGGHLVARYLKEVEDIDTVFALSGGHIQQILGKRETLSLQRTSAQSILADLVASQAEMDGALIGLADGDLESVPEGETWSVAEVLDHTVRVYDAFLSAIQGAL